MKYRPRLLETKLKQLSRHFPVILLTGARQSGKSTLLGHLFGKKAKHIIFDPVSDDLGARRDPGFFLQQHLSPLILDEVQYAPDLLVMIKKRVDQYHTPGQYFLTGSQNLTVLKSVQESMAGRVAVVELDMMSFSEREGMAPRKTGTWIDQILAAGREAVKIELLRGEGPSFEGGLFKMLWRGGFPGTLGLPQALFMDYFKSYLNTYVERDIRMIADVADQQLFGRFYGLVAALTAQEVNHSHLGRELGITPQTAARWLNVLKATFQWFELPAYHGNLVKRLTNKGKGYVADTGLACYLAKVSSPQALGVQPILGPMFETHVVSEIKKMFTAKGVPANLYHWRAHSGAEVDLVIEQDGMLWPLEIKCKTMITARDIAGIKAFHEAYQGKCGIGIIVAAVEKPYYFSKDIVVLPYTLGAMQRRN